MLNYLKLETKNSRLVIPQSLLRDLQSKITKLPAPAFLTHQVNLLILKKSLQPYQKYQNVIIIANGGSRTTALGFYQALKNPASKKNFEFLSTMDPAVIFALKKKYSPQNTLVMPISKSGANVDVLEPLLQFLNYPVLPVTSQHQGVLCEIAQKYHWPIINHPEVGGRFSGRTECGFAPAILMNLPVAKINQAAVDAYQTLSYQAPLKKNPAFLAAAISWLLEKKGYTEIFMPVYSASLAGFLPLLTQLIHESTGKNKKGQTFYGAEAPESQHHTNQRFFGGKRNVFGWFITVTDTKHNLITKVPAKIKKLALRHSTLVALHNIPLQTALQFDYQGVAENANKLHIPNMTLTVSQVCPESVGELLSFFHYYAVYSALLRQQNPFDQPEVEAAKAVSFKKRQVYSI